MNACKSCNTEIPATGLRGRPALTCATCKAAKKAARKPRAPKAVTEAPQGEPAAQ